MVTLRVVSAFLAWSRVGLVVHGILCVWWWVGWCAHTHNNGTTPTDGPNYDDRTKKPTHYFKPREILNERRQT